MTEQFDEQKAIRPFVNRTQLVRAFWAADNDVTKMRGPDETPITISRSMRYIGLLIEWGYLPKPPPPMSRAMHLATGCRVRMDDGEYHEICVIDHKIGMKTMRVEFDDDEPDVIYRLNDAVDVMSDLGSNLCPECDQSPYGPDSYDHPEVKRAHKNKLDRVTLKCFHCGTKLWRWDNRGQRWWRRVEE